jgi:hypothetical protein
MHMELRRFQASRIPSLWLWLQAASMMMQQK